MELEEFVAAHYPRLLRVAYLLTGDQHAAEDLLQETLARSWAYARRARIEQPGAFIRRSLVNLYVSQWRRGQRVREVPVDHTGLPDPAVADRAEAVAVHDEVWTALSRLPRHQRAILVLRFYEDMTEAQIADVLGVGVGAVRSGAWRGLDRLRATTGLERESHIRGEREDQNA